MKFLQQLQSSALAVQQHYTPVAEKMRSAETKLSKSTKPCQCGGPSMPDIPMLLMQRRVGGRWWMRCVNGPWPARKAAFMRKEQGRRREGIPWTFHGADFAPLAVRLFN